MGSKFKALMLDAKALAAAPWALAGRDERGGILYLEPGAAVPFSRAGLVGWLSGALTVGGGDDSGAGALAVTVTVGPVGWFAGWAGLDWLD